LAEGGGRKVVERKVTGVTPKPRGGMGMGSSQGARNMETRKKNACWKKRKEGGK